MSRVILPFNHQPIAAAYRNGTSYSVTAGRYARVTVNVYVYARGVPFLSGVNSTNGATSDTHNVVLEYWLVEGQTIDVALTNASATTGSVNSGLANASTVAEVQINGNNVAVIRAGAQAWHYGSAAGTSTVTGSSSHSMYIEEYNELT